MRRGKRDRRSAREPALVLHRGGPYSTPPRGTIVDDYVGEEKFSVTDRWLTAVPQTPLLTDPATVTAERLCCRN
ncbi:hypothetical protein DVG80_34175 [Rhodococcus erythropolis]|nr:hypothetical protein DVG80_34175 [Rhodococcus erythropolis]